MKVKLAKWGNSVALRLPKRLADELELVPGKTVELEKEGRCLVIGNAERPKIPQYRLQDLLAQIKPGDVPPPLEDWSAVEVPWPDED